MRVSAHSENAVVVMVAILQKAESAESDLANFHDALDASQHLI
jgi:hypothetical protein